MAEAWTRPEIRKIIESYLKYGTWKFELKQTGPFGKNNSSPSLTKIAILYFVNYKFYGSSAELLNSIAKSDLRVSINSFLKLNFKHIRCTYTDTMIRKPKQKLVNGIATNFCCKETFWTWQLTKYLHCTFIC